MSANPKLILVRSESSTGVDLAFPKMFAANVAIVSQAEKELARREKSPRGTAETESKEQK